MTDAKFSWYGNFYGLAWRTHAGNPIAVPLFVEIDEATKIAEIIKTWNPKLVHLTFIENDDGTYAICVYEEPDKSGENVGIYRSGMSQGGTYAKIKAMIEKNLQCGILCEYMFRLYMQKILQILLLIRT